MRILQRYILIELIRVLVLIIGVMTVLLVFVGVFREATERGLGPLQALQIIPYIVPSMLPFTIPATLLLAVCVVYGRLSADYEITAAKAAGINVMSLLFPAFFLGGALTVCSLLLNDQVIPWSMQNIERIVTLAMEDIFFDVLSSQNLVEDPQQGYSISVASVDREQRRLIMPNIRYTPRGGREESFVAQAREATLRFDLERQEIVLHLTDAWLDAPGKMQGRLKDKEIALPMELGGSQMKPRHLTIRDIENQLESLRLDSARTAEQQAIEAAFALSLGEFESLASDEFQQRGHHINGNQSQVRRNRTELHNRFALSCSCFFFAFVGGPFAILQARRQFLTTFFLCFLPILLVYYPVVLLTLNLSIQGHVHPGWAMWVGNAILLVSAAVVLRKAVRN
ncbi:LptF/LptG family permease [bacterium]|nr:LptF/LptG family permease [bacterium]